MRAECFVQSRQLNRQTYRGCLHLGKDKRARRAPLADRKARWRCLMRWGGCHTLQVRTISYVHDADPVRAAPLSCLSFNGISNTVHHRSSMAIMGVTPFKLKGDVQLRATRAR